MSEQQAINIKQRIVGALVLVSLGIIIIPLLLNGGATSNAPISDDNIPDMPKKLTRTLPKVPQPMVMPAAKIITAYPERALTNTSNNTSTNTSKRLKNKNEPKAQTPESKPKVITDTKYEKVQKPATKKITMAYTIQIASFSKKSNADALQKKLRKKKYKAYIESIMTSNGRIYRLRVGPYLKFEQISSIKKHIEKQFKLKKTVIIKY